MADIRIKDLSSASSSASDDFIAVDGTTNGTRKLNAFSPTFGGNATVTGTLTTNGYTFTSGTLSLFSSTAGIYNYYSGGVGVIASYSDGSGTRAQTQIAGSTVLLNTAAGNALTVSAAGVVAIPATTASTSTSTGALVVGGGVGIAQALFAGESAYFAGAVGASDAVLKNGFGRSANGNSYLDLVGDTTYTDYGLRMIRGSAGANAISEIVHRGTGDFRITTNEAASLVLRTAATAALTLTSAQKAEFAATIKTAAPSGGTAAEWKLGTVASVSPTSPNRTIEVDIGGTIYYIHAKTTNN